MLVCCCCCCCPLPLLLPPIGEQEAPQAPGRLLLLERLLMHVVACSDLSSSELEASSCLSHVWLLICEEMAVSPCNDLEVNQYWTSLVSAATWHC